MKRKSIKTIKSLTPAIVADYQDGEQVQSILQRFDISSGSLYDLLRKEGIEPGRQPGPQPKSLARLEQVLQRRRDGLTLAAIGQALDPPVSRQRVAQLVHQASVTLTQQDQQGDVS